MTFPIRADAASRTLVGADGQKILLIGDAAWSLMVQLNQAEVEQYLNDRRSRGFNAVLVNLIEHKFATAPPANSYGEVPFTVAGDFATPNDAYFARAEWVVQQAQVRGLAVMLAPMYLGYLGGDQGWYQELKANGPAKALAYGRYIGQRFAKYPNVIWVQGGDMPSSDVLAEIEAVVTGIRESNGTVLHTAHSQRGSSSLDDYGRPWLGLDSFYTDCAGAQPKARAEWSRATTLPSLHIEGIYENEGASEACLLGQMYYTVLNGARGHVFGNRPMWLFDAGWQAALDSTGARFMQHAAALFRSREGASLIPDTTGTIVVSFAGTPGADDYAAAARSASGRTVLVYIPTYRTITVNTALVPGPQYRAWWYNPRDGQSVDIGTATGGPLRDFTTPAGGPWVLVVDALDVSGAPGSPGQAVNRYRLYSDITKEHHYSTDENEYIVLGTRSWLQEGIAHRVYTSNAAVQGVTPVPLYRLYHAGILQHLWTTDANEYSVLGARGWTQEGVDGYILPSSLAGVTVPLYRLAYAYLPIHLWTTDANEYSVLPSRGWIQEGAVGHVVP